MKFIAYDPETGQKFKLMEHSQTDEAGRIRYYYSDDKDNFVYINNDRQLFEYTLYSSVMKVIIANKSFYLIGEY
ncbi:hypothetical protein OHW47_13035 [Acinetobacter baumannii]|nr:hypothetical protein [Acinetobacter baumannii]MDC5233514.1 hypothetical protein [Acinetobacter baumannii]